MRSTGWLSVSGDKLNNCEEIINVMQKLGINGHVSKNTTILDGSIECGCNILIASQPSKKNAKQLWNHLKDKFDLKCGYVNINGHEEGCVYDVFGPSKCPGKKKTIG